jgi:hypothetical protein
MSKQETQLTPDQQELLDTLYRHRDMWLIEDVYLGGEPLTIERKRALGWPVTAEEALVRMQENKRKQEESEQ